MALLNITRWPTIMIFLFAGIAAATFAFVTVNLFSQAMASLDFLKTFGWEAIRHGALRQVAELAVWGTLSLSCWLSFKVCEHVLEDRYLEWAHGLRTSRRDSDR
ncbi:hypothetical protein [Antarctobacter heliothermus]|uniref:Uncharacterized protein n=1 Tax=Antarctobacter heliothermus TaxID=74033 RepID=A0A239J6C4_9RHOB|nr:hypothetical protein [Antarctobacter heliothermus]SNT01407.1 hypothetical protein SAMN04488078_104915 [Antarctobacter heliothermus]